MAADTGSLDLLMARLAEGDREAFTPVFEALWAPTQRLCKSLLKNDADAADAAQEAMQKILERASDYDKTRPALPWAMAIAAWECRTILRRRTRRRETYDAVPEAVRAHAEAEYIGKELTNAALAALGELSEMDREALMATYWDTASAVSGATLRKRRARALDRLRTAFRRIYGLD